jgi:preprotein translocase subunit SecG
MPGEVKWGAALLVGAGIVWVGWKLPPILLTFHILLCFVLIMVILLQSGSAADLAGAFGGAGSQTAFGPRTAATFLSRATTWCAVMFMVTSLALSVRQSNTQAAGAASILEKTAPKTAPAPQPKAPSVPVLPPANPPSQAPAQQNPSSQPPAPHH